MNWFKKFMLPKDALYDVRYRAYLIPYNTMYRIIYWSGFRWKKSGNYMCYRDVRQLNKRTISAKLVDRWARHRS